MKTLLIPALLCLLAVSALAKTPPPPLEGVKAPLFTLISQEGKPVSLLDYKGKWVVLYFYPKDFTGGCTVEAHGFQKNLAKFEEKGAVIIGVSGQSANSHKDFCAKEGLNFKLLADDKMAVSKSYGSIMNLGSAKLSERNTFVISPGGFVAKRFLKVDPAGHAAEVLAALADLQAKK